ncbi:MAG TPA: response regulator [Gammaproteobacteria bacterium]|nr:response regulator [Gammaproteobacteria bacterium]
MKRILLVEDSTTQAFFTSRILEKNGYEVIVAASGDEGIEYARQMSPDLVIMDVVLPGANGFQATRAITKGVTTRHIPVVMLSSKDQTADKVWALRQGAMNYLVKPVREEELIATVGHLLGEN